MTRNKQASRRDFLKSTAVAAAGASLAGGLNIARSAHAQGSDVLKACLVGCGGRGQGAIRDCLDAAATTGDKVKVVAVADAFEDKAQGAAERLKGEEKYKDSVDIGDRVFGGLDSYKKAIDAGVDLVVTAAAPGFRPIHYRYAVERGKHVFMEKPCCVDAPGFRSLMETNKMADDKNLKVVVGLQRRHDPKLREAVAKVQEGAIGDLTYLRAYWNGGGVWVRDRAGLERQLGRTPTEMEYQVNNWYYFVWLSGDHICEQHVHNLDMCNWVMNGPPVEANGMGGRQVRKGPEVGHIYDHHFIEFTYANGIKMYSQCRHIPNTWSPVTQYAHGTKGMADLERPSIEGETNWRYRGEGVNPYKEEHVHLLKAIRSGEKLNDGWFGATSSFTAVFGRMATYSGQVVKWDEAVAKGPNEYPHGTELAFDTQPPIVPQDGSYEHAVAMPGVYKAY